MLGKRQVPPRGFQRVREGASRITFKENGKPLFIKSKLKAVADFP